MQYDAPFEDPLANLRKEGNALFAQGRYAEAIMRYESALKLDPTKNQESILRGNIAMCCLRFGHALREQDEAGLNTIEKDRQIITDITAKTNTFPPRELTEAGSKPRGAGASGANTKVAGYYNRRDMPAQRHFQRALDEADLAITADDLFVKNYHRRSCALIALGRYSEAVAPATTAADLQPSDKEYHSALVCTNTYVYPCVYKKGCFLE